MCKFDFFTMHRTIVVPILLRDLFLEAFANISKLGAGVAKHLEGEPAQAGFGRIN